jgi:uncharacterized membrane protein
MNNMASIFFWWLSLVILGVISFPLAQFWFKKFADKGYGLAKTLGLLTLSYTAFVLSTVKVIPFTRVSVIILILAYAVSNFWIFTKNKSRFYTNFKKALPLIVVEELLFAFGFFLWTFIRAQKPEINGLEKFMDFGFINSILRSRFLPPVDMWFAGKSINYYWFGHFVTALIIKTTGVTSGVGYNLMLGTILGLSMSSSFSLISTLSKNFQKKISIRKIIVAGLISAVLLNFAGNFHTPYYVLKNGINNYWYPDATRFIGYNPDVPDKTIHEFPIYSYVVSDLHAHLLNITFVLFFLSLLYSALTRKQKMKTRVLLFSGVTLGIMFMTNAWDFANYLLAAGFVFLIHYISKKGISFNTIYKTAMPIVVIILTAVIAVLPFVAHFESIAQGVNFTHTKTPLWQLTILWGFPGIMTLIFIWRLISIKEKAKEDFYILALLITSWVLIALPEFIYVKDIYAATHYRANTMFKLTYQAYVMSYLSTGYIVVRTISSFRRLLTKLFFVFIFAVIFASIMYYPFNAIKSYYGNLKTAPSDLSGDEWLSTTYPYTLQAISWLKQNINGQPTILEAPGDSYTYYDVISSYTGLPTVSGWYVHEWLWRGSPDFPQARVDDITKIYESDNVPLTISLLKKYSVMYVVVGSFEKEKYPNLNEEKFGSLGKEVFATPTTKIYKLNI